MKQSQVGDIGTVIRLTIKDVETLAAIDISSCTKKEIVIYRPGTTKLTVTASFVTDGTDGQIKWTTTTVTDLPSSGIYRAQAYVEMPSGKWHTTAEDFKVIANL